jgi:hypothetical protein
MTRPSNRAITFRITPIVKQALKKHAKDQETTMSKIIDTLLTDYLESQDLLTKPKSEYKKKTVLKESDLL